MSTRKRKLWKVVDGSYTYRPESKSKAYAYVQNAVGNIEARHRRGNTTLLLVYVDERLGRGWELYEDVDLDDLARLEAEADQ